MLCTQPSPSTHLEEGVGDDGGARVARLLGLLEGAEQLGLEHAPVVVRELHQVGRVGVPRHARPHLNVEARVALHRDHQRHNLADLH